VGAHTFFGCSVGGAGALQGLGVATFRTDAHGAVIFYLDGRSVEATLLGR